MTDETPSILVIEDNPATLSLLFSLFDEAGFEVLVSQDGESALTSAKAARPNIILLDVLMSGINGFETCRRLKLCEETREIPVMFMTALTKTIEKVKGFELGAVDYITKPIEPEEVLMRVKTHLMLQQLQRDVQTRNSELHAALERERELNQLKSRFISMASHEVRTPLATIQSSSYLLRRYIKRFASQEVLVDMEEEMDAIEHAVTQMTATMDEVLTLSKSEAGKIMFSPISFDLGELCRNLVQRFRAITDTTHQIEFPDSPPRIRLLADPKLVEQILSNLLSNAIKYSPPGNAVVCTLRECEGEAVLSVQDNGIGISDDDQTHLFEAFYRGTNVGNIQGTGLGLSIIKQFIDLHEGRIEIDSRINNGTTVTVTLPLKKAER